MNFSITSVLWMTAILCVITLFCSCSTLQKSFSSSFGRIKNKTCLQLNQLYDMECIGIGFGNTKDNKKIHDIYFRFKMNKVVDVDEARKIGLATTEVIMKNIIEEPDFLKQYSFEFFNESNLNIILMFLTPDEEEVFDPDVSVVFIVNDQIIIKTEDHEPPHLYKSVYTESLEEARAKVMTQQKTLN